VRTRSFWGLGVGDMLTGLIFAIFNFHLVYYLTVDLGDEEQATQIYSVFLACLALGVMVFGPMADWFPMRAILTVCYLLPALAVMLLLPPTLSVPLAFGFAMVGGLAGGGRSALFPTALVHCFGETHMASIFGLSNTLFILGNAVGPLIGGLIYDATTSTRAVYAVAIVVLAISAGLVSLIRAERMLNMKAAPAIDSGIPGAGVSLMDGSDGIQPAPSTSASAFRLRCMAFMNIIAARASFMSTTPSLLRSIMSKAAATWGMREASSRSITPS
jgi:MFS family permease